MYLPSTRCLDMCGSTSQRIIDTLNAYIMIITYKNEGGKRTYGFQIPHIFNRRKRRVMDPRREERSRKENSVLSWQCYFFVVIVIAVIVVVWASVDSEKIEKAGRPYSGNKGMAGWEKRVVFAHLCISSVLSCEKEGRRGEKRAGEEGGHTGGYGL